MMQVIGLAGSPWTILTVALMLFVSPTLSGCGDDGDKGNPPPAATPTPDPSDQIQPGTLIHLDDGMVQGEIDGGTRRFLGIPFAEPPLGNLRWVPPQPAIPWEGVLEANEFGDACAQNASIQAGSSESEDCLYLNVWTPDPAPTAPLPVMVWIHGGSNNIGSASDLVPLGLGGLFYNGRMLAETRDVVVVTINYRLGVFGFLAHPALAVEDPDYPYSGNLGLLDQRLAFEWARDNVRAFGGDPDNVTIFGESAGAFDVCFHNVSPGSQGLFHRAISQSGGCTTRAQTADEAVPRAEEMISALGCDGAADVLACLREVPVVDLLEHTEDFGPVVDGGVVPDQPRALFDSGAFAKVPYILGSNSDEATLFFIGVPPITTEEEYLAALTEQYGDLADDVFALYPPDDFDSPNDALIRVATDSGLVCSTYDSARRAAAGGADVHLYNFARPIPLEELAPLDLGATHGAEIAYVFGSLEPPTPIDEMVGLAMQGYWSGLAHAGDPNRDDQLPWPSYDDATDQRINFDAEISVLTGFRREECEFWWATYDAAFE